MSDKIRAQHLTRKAMLYVRQSSAQRSTTIWRARSCSNAMQDRLLLGVKGSLNEYELDLLHQRSLEALGERRPNAAKR